MPQGNSETVATREIESQASRKATAVPGAEKHGIVKAATPGTDSASRRRPQPKGVTKAATVPGVEKQGMAKTAPPGVENHGIAKAAIPEVGSRGIARRAPGGDAGGGTGTEKREPAPGRRP